MEISLSGKIVLATGSIIVSKNDTIDFTQGNLSFRFSFEENETSEPAIKTERRKDQDGSEFMAIIFINAMQKGFRSFCPPINVAEFDGKILSVTFSLESVLSNSADTKILTYTWTITQ